MDHREKQSVGPSSAKRDPVLRDVLRCYPFDLADAGIEHPPTAQGFSGAVIVRVVGDTADLMVSVSPEMPFSPANPARYCLRGWPPSGLPRGRLRELHHFLRFVDRHGIDVLPVPFPDIRGETLVSQAGRDWQLEPWMPGVADFHQRPSDARLQSAMSVLARFHGAATLYQPTPAGRQWFASQRLAPSPAVGERLVLLDRWSDERLRQASQQMSLDVSERFGRIAGEMINRFWHSRDNARRQLSAMSQRPVPLHPCLRDVWHDHLLFTGDEVTGLVDPSATRTENVAADLSRLLGSLLGQWSERWETALDWYAQARRLSGDERQLVRVLHDSGVLLSGMTWIKRRMAGSIPDDRLPSVIARMEAIRNRFGT